MTRTEFEQILENNGFRGNFILGGVEETTVMGKRYYTAACFIGRCVYAVNQDGIAKIIHAGGYISNERTVRKAIAYAYGLESFRK